MQDHTILYIAPALPIGGAEKFLVSLMNASDSKAKNQLLVSLSGINPLQSEFDPAIKFYSFARKSKFDVKPIFQLRKLIRHEKPELVVCLNFFSYFMLRCAIFGLGAKLHTIISYHSTIHPNKKEDLLHRLYAAILRKNELVVTVSKNQAKYTADRYNIPIHSFKTIYNGINTGRWTLPVDGSERTRIRAEYQVPADAKVIVITAAFRVEKNHLGAIRALDILHKDYACKPYLLLVGNGVTLKNIKKLVNELKLQEYVKFADIQKDVRPFYWASDLFTLCSTSVETFSIAALEAMGCGLPCVLTDIGGASEMIMEGVNGYLCKPDEKDIALTWLRVLNGNFSGQVIYDFVNQRFRLDKMLKEYRETFDGYLE